MSGHLRDGAGRTYPVRDGLILGRVAGCDVVLADGKASRRHAKIVVEAGVVELEDLGSSNGTLLNGKPVTRRVLRDRDEIQIGATVIVYLASEAPRTAAAPVTPAPAPAPAPGGGGDLFGDDDDLFGGEPAAPVGKAVPVAPVSQPSTPPPAPSVPPAPPPPPAAPAASPLPAAPRVVEFADEVVEVKRRDEPAAKAKAVAPPTGPTVQSQQRILQFAKKDGKGGVLGDDLAQVGGGARWLVYLAVLAVGVGVAYGIVVMMR